MNELKILLAQQGAEAGLHEMSIGGQSDGESSGAHDLERDAVGQRPFLVRTLAVEVETLAEPMIVRRRDLELWIARQVRNELRKPGPIGRVGNAVTQLHQYPDAGQEAVAERPAFTQ